VADNSRSSLIISEKTHTRITVASNIIFLPPVVLDNFTPLLYNNFSESSHRVMNFHDEIGKKVIGAEKYVFQQFNPSKTLLPSAAEVQPYTGKQIRTMARRLEKYVKKVEIRGV